MRSRMFKCFAISAVLGAASLHGWINLCASEPSNPPKRSAADTSGKFVVHEWGTFTTFSGSNGVHLDFRPLRDYELPNFVVDRAGQSGEIWFSKGRLRTRVRMETPVTYFYTDVERKVKVDVEFPKGLLTEFYPPVREQFPVFNSQAAFEDGEPIGKGKLNWGEVTLIPQSSLRPRVSDEASAAWIGRLTEQRILPDASGNDYQWARQTDSALVHVHIDSPEEPAAPVAESNTPRGHFLEKFLFYRGVGKFDVPVTVTSDEARRFTVTNQSEETLKRAIVFCLDGTTITYSVVPDIAPGKSVSVSEPTRIVELGLLRELMHQELVNAGLYDREAMAMLNTWNNSWFNEQGTRLFYLVPQRVTDQELPLHISPMPDATVRVMVGRVEIMSADEEKRLIAIVRASSEKRQAILEKTTAELMENPVAMVGVPEEFYALGRLAEPALCRIREVCSEAAIRDEATAILEQLTAERETEEENRRAANQASR